MEIQWGSNFQSTALPEVSNDLVPQEDLTEENSDVWDDSALITAWDHAVKEYQSFHSIKTEKISNKTDNIKNKGALSKKTQPTSESGEASTPSSAIDNISSKQDSNEIKRAQSVDRDGESILKSIDDKKVRGKKSMGSREASIASKGMPPYYSHSSSHIGYPSYSYQQYPGYYSYPSPPKAGSSFENPTKAEADISTDQTQKEGIDASSADETGHTHMHNSDSATGWRPMQPPKPQTAVPPPMIDDEALSNLLMAWYYSGYYTGLFQVNKWFSAFV
ncbi:14464_t:CDS:2 [Cetraspora pellucida]|uniref:14464_t:CDS:1 n=1 Tax=Cetraspora pellucida TaxID=1433469 RepID=A0A9N9HNT7_9GLOM|nr:14464_t:CDS:2 [Cetraspora pellucida]